MANIWDGLQIEYKCCGVDSWRDWGGNIPAMCSNQQEELRGCLTAISDLFAVEARVNICCEFRDEIVENLKYVMPGMIMKDVLTCYLVFSNPISEIIELAH